ncbi:MAG: DUF1569 domain-containing protein [Planctomycetota bacterium]
MTVNPKTVTGRRDLTFHSLDDVLADVEQLAASANVRTLGNWSFDRLLSHLAMTFRGSVDGFQSKAPLWIRLILPVFKKRVISHPLRPGIRLPASVEVQAYPTANSLSSALEDFRRSIQRARTERMEKPHPAFGRMTHEEWLQLHLRHCEMHLSFVVVR